MIVPNNSNLFLGNRFFVVNFNFNCPIKVLQRDSLQVDVVVVHNNSSIKTMKRKLQIFKFQFKCSFQQSSELGKDFTAEMTKKMLDVKGTVVRRTPLPKHHQNVLSQLHLVNTNAAMNKSVKLLKSIFIDYNGSCVLQSKTSFNLMRYVNEIKYLSASLSSSQVIDISCRNLSDQFMQVTAAFKTRKNRPHSVKILLSYLVVAKQKNIRQNESGKKDLYLHKKLTFQLKAQARIFLRNKS